MKKPVFSIAILCVVTFTSPALIAGSFGDSFSKWLLGSEAEASLLRQDQPALDEVAEGCMQCHNGMRATHIVVKNADSPLQLTSSGMQVNHPVGMSYDDYAVRKPRDYVPRFSLDPDILLVNGQVSCVSCHSLKETDEVGWAVDGRLDKVQLAHAGVEDCTASGELTVGHTETELCLACHNM
jgi:hypothetical protein